MTTPLIATLAATGLRRSEVLALTVDDVEGSPGARQVAVRHGKGDKYRAVPVDPRLEELLAAYLVQRWARWPVAGRARPADPWSAPARAALWLGDKGQLLTSAQLAHLVERAYRAAGINSHATGALVHALRRTFATSLLENGATAIEVMGLLGHASLATTQRYLTTRSDHLRGAVRRQPRPRQRPHGLTRQGGCSLDAPGRTATPPPTCLPSRRDLPDACSSGGGGWTTSSDPRVGTCGTVQ